MSLFGTAISFTAILIWRDGGFGGMEENKKSGGGDVRAEALARDDERDKV